MKVGCAEEMMSVKSKQYDAWDTRFLYRGDFWWIFTNENQFSYACFSYNIKSKSN